MSLGNRKLYSFSKSNDAHPVTIFISKELHERILTLCNITELTQTGICRYLLTRGVAEMETKLIKLRDAGVA